MTTHAEEQTTSGARSRGARRAKTGPAKLDLWGLALTGLVILTSVPLAVLVIPNTISLVAGPAVQGLGADPQNAAQVVRAYGLALPALLLTVPVAAGYARRTRAWPLLLAGLGVLGLTQLLAEAVGSVFLLTFLRIFQGIGAGVVLPATLVLVTRQQLRGQRLLSAWWAGVLMVSLMAATPLSYLTLYGDDWRAVMQPYPALIALALLCTAALIFYEVRVGTMRPGTREGERILLLPALPALGLSVFAVGASFNWATWALLVLAITALIVMYGLTTLGAAFDGRPGTNHVVVAVSAGVVVLPVTAQMVNLSVSGFGGPGLSSIWLPLGLAMVVTLVGAVGGVLGRPESATRLTVAGLVAAGAGLLAVRLLMPAGDWLLFVVMILLGGGFGLAFGASLRGISSGAALLGLGLVFPAVLSGQLLSGAIMLRATESIAQNTLQPQVVHGLLLAALGAWVTVSALVLLVAVADVSLASVRRRGRRRKSRPSVTEEHADEHRDEHRDEHAADDADEPAAAAGGAAKEEAAEGTDADGGKRIGD